MPDYDDNNKGALFVNDRKKKETHPDMKGSVTINGVEYWLSAWSHKKASVTGGKYLSLAFTEKEQQASGDFAERAQTSTPAAGADDSGLPF